MPDTHNQLVADLMALASEADIELELAAANVLVEHLQWVLRTNETLNLTALTNPREAVRLHILDSLYALPEVVDAPDGILIDLGTGGGYPGLPLAVASGRSAILLDSVKKKVHALELFLRDGGADPRAEGMRAEEYAMGHPGEAAVVVARAVAPTASLVELAAPLLMMGGRLIALKGNMEPDEIEGARQTAERCGMTYRSTRAYALPRGRESRSVVVFESTGKPDTRLPRRIGMAQKRPLR